MFRFILLLSSLHYFATDAAPLNRILSVTNVYPDEYDLEASFSVIESANLALKTSTREYLSFRPFVHNVSPFVRIANEKPLRLRCFTDKGYFHEFDPAIGSYNLFHSHKVGKAEAQRASQNFLWIDHPIVPSADESASKGERFFAADPLKNFEVLAYSARNGTVLEENIGRINVENQSPLETSYPSWLPRDTDPSATADKDRYGLPLETLFLARNSLSHSQPAEVLAFDIRTNTTSTVWKEKSSDANGTAVFFCGLKARPKTRQLFALVEEHNPKQFPDQDCQNVSGLVERFAILELPWAPLPWTKEERMEKARVVWESPDVYMGKRSGGPLDDEAGLWHILNAGEVMSVNVTDASNSNRNLVTTLGGDIEGIFPVLIPGKHQKEVFAEK
eukprot:g4685.t1